MSVLPKTVAVSLLPGFARELPSKKEVIMENLTKGALYECLNYCKHCCYGYQHSCDTVQHIQKIDNQKATASRQSMVAF